MFFFQKAVVLYPRMLALLNTFQVSLPFLLVIVPLVTMASPFSSCRFSRVAGEGKYVPLTFHALSSFKFTYILDLGTCSLQLVSTSYIFVPMFEISIFIKNSGCRTCLDYPSFQPSPFCISATLFSPSTIYTSQKKKIHFFTTSCLFNFYTWELLTISIFTD